MIPLKELEIGECYELDSRNLRKGVWDGKEFHGIRLKFGDLFMDSEIHYDLDDHYGTAKAISKLEPETERLAEIVALQQKVLEQLNEINELSKGAL